ACSGAHHWAREIRALGHSVQLLPAQHVKAYLRGQKNDYNDALAIAEAVQHGRIRCVEIKAVDQQLDQSLHRLRQALVTEQTGLINRTRALLAEHGVDLPEGNHRFRQAVIAQLEDAQNGLPWRLRELLGRQYQLFIALEQELAWYEREIKTKAAENEACQRLMRVPGYGPIVSSAFYGWLGSGQQFRCGRDVAAALGLVPKQYSTGGKTVLGGISKRGEGHGHTGRELDKDDTWRLLIEARSTVLHTEAGYTTDNLLLPSKLMPCNEGGDHIRPSQGSA